MKTKKQKPSSRFDFLSKIKKYEVKWGGYDFLMIEIFDAIKL
jgi:hypothetical protein